MQPSFPYYLVLGTLYKESRGQKREIRAPYQIFRIDGPQTYAQCTSTEPSNFNFVPLDPQQQWMLHAKVHKWIVQRCLPSTAPSIVTNPAKLEHMVLRDINAKNHL